MKFSKLHATGNDFLVAVELAEFAPSFDQVRALCDRHRGIGADGVITLHPRAIDADCGMELRNADGGFAEMSGNGIRCLAWVAKREGLGADGRLLVATDAGVREVIFGNTEGDLRSATVDMGSVTFEPSEIPVNAPSAFDLEATYHGTTYRGDAAGVGNPHFVLLVDDVDAARVTQHGPHLEVDERFPNHTNVEFVQVLGRDRLRLRVWERGVGETLSCGTGVCAASAVARRRDLVGSAVQVEVPGGIHTVELGDTVVLGGEVQHVFDVDVDAQALVGRLA